MMLLKRVSNSCAVKLLAEELRGFVKDLLLRRSHGFIRVGTGPCDPHVHAKELEVFQLDRPPEASGDERGIVADWDCEREAVFLVNGRGRVDDFSFDFLRALPAGTNGHYGCRG
jgi:hypothetical protein